MYCQYSCQTVMCWADTSSFESEFLCRLGCMYVLIETVGCVGVDSHRLKVVILITVCILTMCNIMHLYFFVL